MYKAPRGTSDILSQDQRYWRYVEGKAANVCQFYGYRRIDTPIFEEAGLFIRGVGAGTDIVEKEMYSFHDRGGDLMTLRAEGTAPVCRAYLEHGMYNLPQPVKLYYIAPIFRYERPQAGRYRQHQQFGCEAIGDADPALDAEVIDLAWKFLGDVGLRDPSLILNSIGCPVCRPRYLEALTDYYKDKADQLCPDCRKRLERNPLRLLDCKLETCSIVAGFAPKSIDYLCPECRQHFESLRHYLEIMNLPYLLDHRLVRGLDYYTRTVFEIQPEAEGAQSALCGGGRYDNLIEELGGKPTPAVGFGSGLDRIILNIKRQEISVPPDPNPDVYIAYVGSEAKAEAVKLAGTLRRAGIMSFLAFGDRSLKAQMRQANTVKAAYAIVIGEEEVTSGTVVLRDLAKRAQESIERSRLLEYLKSSARTVELS